MAKRGRPIKGIEHVEDLNASDDAKLKLKTVMATLTGEKSIEEACAELGVEKSAFFKMRDRALVGALHGLEPRQVGRPRKEKTTDQERIEDLEEELQEMRIDLEAAYIREELAVAMPHVLIPREERLQKEKERKEKARKDKAAKKKRKEKQRQKSRKTNRKA